MIIYFTPDTFNFIILLSVIAYSLILRLIKIKIYDTTKLQEITTESARLRQELDKASKDKDEQKMNELAIQGEELTRKAIQLNLEMFKNLFLLSIIFLSFIWILNLVSPYEKDDIGITLTKIAEIQNSSCDINQSFVQKIKNTLNVNERDIYFGCFSINEHTPNNTWRIVLKSNSGTFLGDDYFIVNNGTSNRVKHDSPKTFKTVQEKVDLIESEDPNDKYIEKLKTYRVGETLKIYAIKNNYNENSITMYLSNGTSLLWNLPITIPIINVDTITDVNGAFILTLLLVGYVNTFILWIFNKLKKVIKKEDDKNAATEKPKQKHKENI